jgi:hypothetical protein
MKKSFLISFLFLLIMIFGVSSCSDLQKESSNSACNAALDNQDYDTAISVCTSSKELGDAYMGKGKFTVLNLLNNSGGESIPSHISSASGLGPEYDNTGAKIFYILGFAFSQDSDSSSRKTKITNSRDAFKNASSSYSGIITSDKDAALMYTFANVFAMQLDQSLINDKSSSPVSSNATNCTDVSNNSGNVQYDGYIWDYEKYKTQCSHGTDYAAMCSELSGTVTYVANITNGLKQSGSATSSSNTEVISKSKNAVCKTMKAINTLANDTTTCDVSNCD